MLLNKHIGYDQEDGMGIDGKIFAREIFELDSLKPKEIVIYVNSLGGCVENGFDILSAISECKTPVRSVITGFAYSTAGWCTLSADVVEIKSYASGMMHMPYQVSEGSQPSFVSIVASSICKILSSKSGRSGIEKKTEEEIKSMMFAKTYMSSDQMFSNGFVDKVINSEDIIKHIDTETDYKAYQNILNKELFKTIDIMPFSAKILNRLNLADGSDENDVIAAIARNENNLSAANKENERISNLLKASNESQEELARRMKEMQTAKETIDNSMTEKETALNSLNKEMEDLKTKIKNLEDEKLAIENKAKEDADTALRNKANEMVAGFVEIGRIENSEDVINIWNNMAFRDYDGTVAILNAMKTNMPLPTVTATKVSNKVEGKVEEGSVEEFRLMNRKRLEEKRNGVKA